MNKKQILEFYDARPVVILSTLDKNGAPRTRALVNIRNQTISPNLVDFFKKTDRMLLMTNTHSEKISQIRKNGAATLYAYDDQYNGLMLTGKMVEILDEETKDAIWDDSLKVYYPNGRHGGDFSIIEFIPETFKSYQGAGFVKKSGEVK